MLSADFQQNNDTHSPNKKNCTYRPHNCTIYPPGLLADTLPSNFTITENAHTHIPKDTAVVTKMKLLLSNVNGLISANTFKGRILFLLFPFKHVAIFEQTMNKERRRKICIRTHQNECMAEIQIKALHIYKHSIAYTVTMVKLRLFRCRCWYVTQKANYFPFIFMIHVVRQIKK